MVKHSVLWKLRAFQSPGERAAAIERIRSGLEGLVGVIPGLLYAQVGENIHPGGADLCLYAEYSDRASLEAYRTHPAHLAVAEFVHSVMAERVSCDWEA